MEKTMRTYKVGDYQLVERPDGWAVTDSEGRDWQTGLTLGDALDFAKFLQGTDQRQKRDSWAWLSDKQKQTWVDVEMSEIATAFAWLAKQKGGSKMRVDRVVEASMKLLLHGELSLQAIERQIEREETLNARERVLAINNIRAVIEQAYTAWQKGQR